MQVTAITGTQQEHRSKGDLIVRPRRIDSGGRAFYPPVVASSNLD